MRAPRRVAAAVEMAALASAEERGAQVVRCVGVRAQRYRCDKERRVVAAGELIGIAACAEQHRDEVPEKALWDSRRGGREEHDGAVGGAPRGRELVTRRCIVIDDR
jgi:hypothetical protein